MRIGIYSPYLQTLTGGEKYIFTAASCLSKEHDVSIFWNDSEILSKASRQFNLELDKVKIVDDIFSHEYSLIKRFFLSTKYDRILFLSDGSIPIVYCKLIVHFQFPVEWVNTNSFPFLFKKSRISKIVCNSYFTKKYIDKKFGKESFVLYPPASTNHDKLEEKENLILTVGRFSILPNGTDFKKLAFLAESFKKFQRKRLKGWKMAIVTSVKEEDEEEFKKFQRKIKNNKITIHKNASHEQIVSLYKKAKIYWHASGYGEDLMKFPERAEHFGISTVEAMSYGAVPVVVDAGGQPEIVKEGENGYLWRSVDELINKTHRLAVQKDLFAKLQEMGIETSKRFGKDRFCEELNHLIW